RDATGATGPPVTNSRRVPRLEGDSGRRPTTLPCRFARVLPEWSPRILPRGARASRIATSDATGLRPMLVRPSQAILAGDSPLDLPRADRPRSPVTIAGPVSST